MTTNKLDELIEDYTIELRNSIGSLLPTPHPDDFKQAIEAYIAESNIKILEKLKVNPIVVIDIYGNRKQLEKPMLYIEDVDNLLNTLKSNER